MTEQHWLGSRNLQVTMQPLLGSQSSRCWRLFAIACVRCIWHLVPEAFHRGIEVAEEYVDRRVTKQELAEVWVPYRSAFGPAQCAACWAACPTGSISDRAQRQIPLQALDAMELGTPDSRSELEAEFCGYLRDIFPFPSRPAPVADPDWLAWNNATVLNLARGIYDEHGFDQMPILADALEDAGCQDVGLLEHCRSSGPHVRGCWLVDLLLGRRGQLIAHARAD